MADARNIAILHAHARPGIFTGRGRPPAIDRGGLQRPAGALAAQGASDPDALEAPSRGTLEVWSVPE
jgi:hypothetical protein